MITKTSSTASQQWNQYLDGTNCTQLPTIWPSKPLQVKSSLEVVRESFSPTSTISDETLLSAWAKVLALFTASEDISFGVVTENDSTGRSDSIRCFPCRITLASVDNPQDVSQRMEASLRQIQTSVSSRSADLQDLISHGTLVNIFRGRSGRDTATENLDVPIRAEFWASADAITVEIHAIEDFYARAYLTEILHQTKAAIGWLTDQRTLSANHTAHPLVLSWIKPCEPLPENLLVHQMVEKQGRINPDAIAVGESERVMTYREVNRWADLLADRLVSDWSDEPGTRNIGIYFEKSIYAIVSMLAVLKTGSTYVPLDVAWPIQRVLQVVENANIQNVLCSKAQHSQIPCQESLRILTVDEWLIEDLKRPSAQLDLPRKMDPSTAAYMLYTSGSTGTPKGISVSHRAISTSIQAMARYLNISQTTRTFQYASFTFDLHVADLWMTLACGGRICLPSEDERLSPDDFIAQERCNYALITPTTASLIDPSILLANIEVLALLGEAVPERLLHRILKPDSPMKVYNTWGPTEASVLASSSDRITVKDGQISLHPNNIGCSIGATMLLVNQHNPHKLADPFVPGEIALVGNTLADGYYHNAEKTQEAFRTDLEWTRNEALIQKIGDSDILKKVYLTGDIGRYAPCGDGTIIFMHRKEGGFVKVNGYRIDPGEIESRIIDVSTDELHVQDTCVVVYEHEDETSDSSKQILVCIFAIGKEKALPGAGCETVDLSTTQAEGIGQIVAWLRDTMPEYMVPRLFVPVESLAVSTSHKIDRNAMLRMLRGKSWPKLAERFEV